MGKCTYKYACVCRTCSFLQVPGAQTLLAWDTTIAQGALNDFYVVCVRTAQCSAACCAHMGDNMSPAVCKHTYATQCVAYTLKTECLLLAPIPAD